MFICFCEVASIFFKCFAFFLLSLFSKFHFRFWAFLMRGESDSMPSHFEFEPEMEIERKREKQPVSARYWNRNAIIVLYWILEWKMMYAPKVFKHIRASTNILKTLICCAKARISFFVAVLSLLRLLLLLFSSFVFVLLEIYLKGIFLNSDTQCADLIASRCDVMRCDSIDFNCAIQSARGLAYFQ